MTTATRPAARFVKPGEMLALSRRHILESTEGGRKAFFWLFGGGTKASERREDVAIVHVRDALEHHSDSWSDNYEDIIQRVRDAMSGVDAQKQYARACEEHRWRHQYDDDYQPMPPMEAAVPPSAVVLCLDSPGGVVSGLNETVRALQKLRKETGVPLIAYVNEMAASAAYALACSCDEIVCPPSAIIGSVGVISTMVSQVEHDKQQGLDVRLITSGARKADGHAHAPITDAAINVEAGRVEELATEFFKIVSKARSLSVDTIRGFQAGIYLGKQAVKRGLADAVMPFDEAIAALSKVAPTPKPKAGGNETDRRAAKGLDGRRNSGSRINKPLLTNLSVPKGKPMSIKLAALIKKTEAAIAKEPDSEKKKALRADLAAYKKTEKHVEHVKTEEDDDKDDEEPEDDKEDEDEEDEDEEEEAKAAAKKAEEKKAEEEKAAAAKKEEEKKANGGKSDEEEEAKAVLALARAATGKRGTATYGALVALLDKAAQYDDLNKRVSSIESQSRKSKRDTLITEAVNAGRITKAMVKKAGLATRKLEHVESYLEMFPTALINTSEDELHSPDEDASSPGASTAALPKHITAQIDAALQAAPASIDKVALREKLEANHRRNLNGAANPRY